MPGKKQCQKHLDYTNLKARERVGKCKQCKEWAVEGKTRCAKHLEECKAQSRERKQRLREQKLCRDCGQPKETTNNLCKFCGHLARLRSKKKLIERQEQGLCTFCGAEKENQDKAYCNLCSDKDNTRLRARRVDRKDKKVCVHCCVPNNAPSALCEDCIVDFRKHSKNLRDRRKNNGLCYKCGKKAVENKVFCFDCNLESSIRQSVKNALIKKDIPKSARTEELLGCSIEFFREHMKNLMDSWMNGDNYGVHIPGERRWQIGHKRPVASFDLTREDQQKECWHYTNLYPQEASENIMMGDLMVVDGVVVRGRYYLPDDMDDEAMDLLG